jgi:hypothetical protein
MSEKISKGYVALFKEPISEETLRLCVDSWLARFEKVEQVCPNGGAGAVTMAIASSRDVLMEEHPQFRVLSGEQFTWIYVAMGRHVMETTGMPQEEISLCVDVLLELPGVIEMIDQRDDRRLDQLEAEGLM